MVTEWWKKAIVYQIYPKSFKDSNGDGIGDLNGIAEKLDYIKDLGANVIWICPMFESPMIDNGYDISDYYKVNPIFGCNEDMENLLKAAKKRNIKILLDLVVNHCSDKHIWFKRAIEDPNCEEAGYFYFKRSDDKKEPNNWRSNFGGSVWTQLPDGRWYFHTFSKEQPDLNWENPKLREKLYKMINWWIEKGVAGFRVDAITFIKKDLSFETKKTKDGFRYPIENLTDYPGIGEFLNELKNRCFEKYDCMTVAEAPGVMGERICDYSGIDGYFSMIFDGGWESMEQEKDKSSIEAVERLKERLFKSQSFKNDAGWCATFLENHDQSRCVNKYLKKENISFYSASALATMYFFLRGTVFIYQGQEIGMTNTVWNSMEEMDDVRAKGKYQEAIDQNQDPQNVLEYFSNFGRDNSRTPMQWTNGKNAGFSDGEPWLKVNENYIYINVEQQKEQKDSLLTYYKKLSDFHRRAPYEEVFAQGNIKPVLENCPAIIGYERTWKGQKVIAIVNLNQFAQKIPNIKEKCIINNYNVLDEEEDKLVLQAYQALVFIGVSQEK